MSAEARAVLAEHSKSFALAGRLLPKESSDDAAVLYAFCRRADDAIDLGAAECKPERLAGLRRELASIYAGEPQDDACSRSFQELALRRRIPEGYASALLDGLETDLGPVRFQTLSELMLYSYRVAGVVGLMMCHVLGLSDARALRRAAHLGMAMQLTNICRDVLEDWERGRTYIPEELLVREGAQSVGVGDVQATSDASRRGLARAVQSLLALADRYYRSGDLGLPALSTRAAIAVRAARHVYAAIGAQLARQDFDPLRGRAVVSRNRKLLLLVRAGVEELAARLYRAIRVPSRRAEPHGAKRSDTSQSLNSRGAWEDGFLLDS